MSTPTSYRLRVRNADDTDDLLYVTSLRDDLENPFIASVPSGDGESLDPLTGQVTVGAYTVQVIDAEDTVATWAIRHQPDFGGYADTAALLADWTEDDPTNLGTWTLATPASVLDSAKVPHIAVNGTFLQGEYSSLTKVFGGFAAGATVRVRWYQYENQTNPHGGANTWSQAAGYLTTANGSGEITVRIGWVQRVTGTVTAKFIEFDRLVLEEQLVAAGRVATSVLAESDGRQQLMSKKAFIEISENSGASWDVMLSGYVNRVALVDALKYEFTIGESKRVEHSRKAFDRIPTADQYTRYETVYGSSAMGVLDRASCLIGGPIVGDWGPHQDRGRPTFKVERVEGQYVALKWVEGAVSANFHELNPPLREDVSEFINQAALEYLDSTTLVPMGGFALAPCPGLVCRLYNVSTGAHVADLTPQAAAFDASFLRRILGDWFFTGQTCQFWVYWDGTPPSTGTRYRLAVFPRSISPRNPFHWTGHPVDLAAQLFAVSGIAYNATSQASVKAALGDLILHLRITQSDTLQQFLEQTVYGPFGFATRRNADGEEEFFLTRTSGQTPVATITLDDLYSSDGTAWEVEESSAANKVVWESKSFLMNDAAGTVNEGTPIDCVLESTITVEVEAEDAAGQEVFGEKEVRFTLPGEIQGYNTGTEDAPGSLDLFVAALAKPLFDWNGRGAIRGEFHVGRWSSGYDAVIGEELIVDCPHIPSASPAQTPSAQRGTVPRRGFILHKTVSPSGAAFKLEDRGLYQSLFLLPTFTLAADATFPKKVVEVTVTNEAALDTAGVTVRVEMTTSGSATAGQFVRHWVPVTDDNPFDLPPVCSGSVVYVRMRAEGTGDAVGTFGPWTAFQSLDLADLTAPSGLAATVEGTTLHLTWTNGEASVPIEVRYRLTAETLTTSAIVLPAGTTSYSLQLPTESVSYTVTIRHLEPEGCASAVATVVVSTDVQLGLAAPIDPTTFSDGIGHHGLQVTATEVTAQVEFWVAVETAIDSGVSGTYELVDTVASVVDGRTSLQHPVTAPNDSKLRFWKARHVKTGYDPSDYTAEVSINPWLVLPPNPDPGGEDETDYGMASVPFEITAHSAGAMPWTWLEGDIPAEVQALAIADYNPETWFPLENVGYVFVTATVRASSLPAGATLAWQYTTDRSDATWAYLDAESGPQIPIDPDSLTGDQVEYGAWVEVTEAARTLVRLRPVTFGGDGTGALILDRVALVGLAARPDVPEETPEPPVEIPPVPPEDPPPVGCNGTDEMPHFAKLKQWLIADCSEIITVGAIDRIDQINDQSGHGNHLTGYGISGNYVLLGQNFGGETVQLNGRDVAVFDAAYLVDPAGMMAGVTDATMSIVLKGLNGDPGGAVNYVYSWKLGGSSQQPIYAGNGNEIFGGGAAGHIYDDFGSDTRHNLGNPTPSLSEWRVLTIRAADSVYKAYLDGVQFYNSATNTVAWAAQGKLGNRGNNSKIAVAERSIHSGITEAQAMDVVATMGDRWGLTVGGGGSVGGDPGSGGDDGQNTGGGPDGDDDVPTPTPATGDRPFSCWAIPSTGAGVWDSTCKVIQPQYATRLLDSASGAGMRLWLKPAGPESGWGKPFNFDAWRRGIDLMAGNADLDAAIASGVAIAHYVIDEPFHTTRYGGPIPFPTVERMCQYSKSIWPTWTTAVRVPPTHEKFTRHMDDLDYVWAQYTLNRGEVTQYRDANLAAAAAFGHSLVIALNITHFTAPVSGRAINADELRYYGRILASTSSAVAFCMWQYREEDYNQVGWPAALEYVQGVWESYDP